MKRFGWILLSLALLWAGNAMAAEADAENLRHWALRATLRPAAVGATLYGAEFPPALLDAARSDLADVRLVDAGSRAKIPYVIRESRGETVREEIPARIFNQAYQPGVGVTATAEIDGRVLRDAVLIQTSGEAFRRRVGVEGSEDGVQWRMLREHAYLFRIGGAARFEKARVELPSNDFRYLRVTVYRDADDPARIEIEQVRVPRSDQTAAPLIVQEPKLIGAVEMPKEKQTWLNFDAGARNLHLADLRLDFADENFWRRVTVYGRQTETITRTIRREDGAAFEKSEEAPWEIIATDIVYRYRGEKAAAESLNIPLPTSPARYLQVRIDNLDDQPLTFRGAKLGRIPVRVIFQGQPGGVYELYLGNPQAVAPSYDLARLIDPLKRDGIGRVEVGAPEANPVYSAKTEGETPWSERYAPLLWVALLAALGILGFLVYRLARQTGASGAP